MTLRRYIGRATGSRRRPKHFPIFWVLSTGATLVGLVLVGVLIMNPGGNRPGSEKGSASPSVMPETTPTPTPTELSGTA